jgi:hypothetical protein
MVSRVFRERELRWIRSAQDEISSASRELKLSAGARRELVASRIASLQQLADVGAALLEAVLAGESVDSLPLKEVGELAKAARERDK